jgi:hypothetical protein
MTSKSKSWRDLLPVHPAAELFPMMSEEELRALGEDIKKNGLREGVALLDGKLLDGRNRLEAMEAVGIKLTTGNGQIEWAKIPSRNVKGSDPIAFVISKNIHRRHLTADQKRDVIAKLIKATPEKSDRQIAEQTRASPTTVGKVRKDLEQAGDVSKLDTRADTKGRKQQARRGPSTAKSPTKSPAVIAAADRAEVRAEQKPRPKPAPKPEQPASQIDPELDKLRADLALERLKHKTTRILYQRALEAHDGIMSRAEFKLIQSCLHPDRVQEATLKKRHEQAFSIFGQCELLIKKQDREPLAPGCPITAEDWLVRKRAATAKPKAKRAARKPSPPPRRAIEQPKQQTAEMPDLGIPEFLRRHVS